MSMHDIPNYGFVMELTPDNLKYLGVWDLLPEATKQDIENVDFDNELIGDALEAAFSTAGLVSPEDFYTPDEEDIPGDSMEYNKTYMIWGVFCLLPHHLLPAAFRRAYEDAKLDLTAWAVFG
jgi:hypothetical protein